MKATRYLFTFWCWPRWHCRPATTTTCRVATPCPKARYTSPPTSRECRHARRSSMPMAQARSVLPTNGACTLLREVPHLRHTIMKTLLTRPTTVIRFIGKTSVRRNGDFSAYYPRITENIANPAAYLYTPEAWRNTDDLLHATATTSKGRTVELIFKHLMHRLVVELVAGDGMEGVDLSSALINSAAKDNAPTMRADVEVNLLTGAVTYDKATSSVVLSNGGNGNADWKVAPQDLTAGEEWLKITVGGDVWYYNVPVDLNTATPGNQTRLESGKRLTINLTLKKNQQTGKNEVELTASEISGWGDGGTITDEVVIGGTTSGVTTYEALLAALKTGGTSADAPTLVTLGSDITIPAGGDLFNTPSMTDNGYFKIDGGGHTLTWEKDSYYFLGNGNITDDAVYIEFANINLVQQDLYMGAVICMYNGKIALSGNVTLNGVV